MLTLVWFGHYLDTTQAPIIKLSFTGRTVGRSVISTAGRESRYHGTNFDTIYVYTAVSGWFASPGRQDSRSFRIISQFLILSARHYHCPVLIVLDIDTALY